MRDHYREFSHPVLVDLPSPPTMNLFDEMDLIADECRAHPQHIEVDDQIAFQQLQKLRRGDLGKGQWLDLFAVWRDHYRARLVVRRAEVDRLWQERDDLLAERAASPSDEIDARLAEKARKLRDFCASSGVIRF